MGKRSSFPRIPQDAYPTPAEAVAPLLPHLKPGTRFVEPCCGDGLPSGIVALLKTVKPDLLRVLAGREAARTALDATAPPDCLPQRWVAAQEGLRRFIADGWGDQAALLGWSPDEFYRVPPAWARVDLTGAALLVADRRVIAVTEASIAIETLSGSQLKFRRIGREHLA